LFFGMEVMKEGLAPIKEDPAFLEFFTKFDPSTIKGLLLSVLVGAGLTIMVQSSSATIGLTMALATQGLLTFPGAMALVLGENIGTTITAELATIGSNNINAHRAARAHTMFNVIGVCIMLLIFPVFIKFILFVTAHIGAGPVDVMVKGEAINIDRYIANGHTMFNVINACFFLIFLPWLIKVAMLLSPKDKKSEDFFRLPTFGNRMIDTPIAAIAEARSEIRRMAKSAIYTFKETVQRIEDRDYKKLDAWKENEHFLDGMQREITAYLTQISQSDVGDADAREISSMMRMTNNIERIGDSVENIAQAVEKLIEEKLQFSPTALADIEIISGKVMEFLRLVSEGMYKYDGNFMQMSEDIENTIDDMREEMRENHICRLRNGECSIEQGLIFINLLTNFEKIGDYCFNIAEAVAGLK
jgi:phosphate:Na+ symporter